MLSLVALLLNWRAIVQPPIFRPEEIAIVARGQALYQSKVNAGRDSQPVVIKLVADLGYTSKDLNSLVLPR